MMSILYCFLNGSTSCTRSKEISCYIGCYIGCYIFVLLGCPYTLARIDCIVHPSVSAVLCVHSCLFSRLSGPTAVCSRGCPGSALIVALIFLWAHASAIARIYKPVSPKPSVSTAVCFHPFLCTWLSGTEP